MYIAHRGLYNDEINENTISAFDNAFDNGFEGIEFDVRLTKDKVPVIIHDSFLSRVSNGKGLVKNYTYNELLKFNFGKKKIERIPKLEDVINRYNNKTMIIELKENIDITPYLNDKNKYYISSFNYNYIKNIPYSDKYKRGVINYVLNPVKDYNKIDFIMVLDSISFDKVLENYDSKCLEVIIYGVVGKINNYKENIKYII